MAKSKMQIAKSGMHLNNNDVDDLMSRIQQCIVDKLKSAKAAAECETSAPQAPPQSSGCTNVTSLCNTTPKTFCGPKSKCSTEKPKLTYEDLMKNIQQCVKKINSPDSPKCEFTMPGLEAPKSSCGPTRPTSSTPEGKWDDVMRTLNDLIMNAHKAPDCAEKGPSAPHQQANFCSPAPSTLCGQSKCWKSSTPSPPLAKCEPTDPPCRTCGIRITPPPGHGPKVDCSNVQLCISSDPKNPRKDCCDVQDLCIGWPNGCKQVWCPPQYYTAQAKCERQPENKYCEEWYNSKNKKC